MMIRPLDPRRPYKPLDVGEAGVAASVDAWGRLTLVTQAHPVHGVVVLDASRGIPPAARFDQAAIRRLRGRLSRRDAPSFGLRAEGSARSSLDEHAGRPAWLLADAIPATAAGGTEPRLATLVPHPDDVDGERGVVQVALPGTVLPAGRWTADVRLARADYPELTEVHPLAPLVTDVRAEVVDGAMVLADPSLGWAVAVAGDLDGPQAGARDGRLRATARIRAGGRAVVIGLGPDGRAAVAAAAALAGRRPDALLEAATARWRDRWAGGPLAAMGGRGRDLLRRALGYAISVCAIPVGSATCLVTDHRILPLAWTRDAYWVARAMLDWLGCDGPAEARETVRRHLEWLFELADRPAGWWARSHLVGGGRKDPVFQLDQQLYPLLELADYVLETGDRSPLDRHGRAIPAVMRAIDARRAPGGALYSTDETPADDPIELPYQTANQILAWRTFDRLDRLGVGGGLLGPLARQVRDAVLAHQVVDLGRSGRGFAYATDLDGRAIAYHDANDLPLALAPRWGFCRADEPAWLATISFAFSSANPGFFAGPAGGLGSRHTPAPWSLGGVQALVVAGERDDAKEVRRIVDLLGRQALWDGSLPEASDPSDARPRSRPWFAWPGASLASELLRGGS